MAVTSTIPPALRHLFAQQVIVGIGDMAVSDNREIVLSTYALGSCIGLVAYEPIRHVGGILHLMLPDSAISPEKAAAHPAMFADTGLPEFFNQLAAFSLRPGALKLFIAGGANVLAGEDTFRIGERNMKATIDFLGRNGFRVSRAETGGSINRTLHLDLGSGQVRLKTPNAEEQFELS
ncbi:MAG TPA: chemotaxis protein CheD [Opitutaceae bacterium]|jgi:chemotaxis protein CheD|nr:chemotaxis protein CheD [Opitutaceae bacterium]